LCLYLIRRKFRQRSTSSPSSINSPSFLEHDLTVHSTGRKCAPGGGCLFESVIPAMTTTDRLRWDRTVKFEPDATLSHDHEQRRYPQTCADGSFHPVELVTMSPVDTEPGKTVIHDMLSIQRHAPAQQNRFQTNRPCRHLNYEFPACL